MNTCKILMIGGACTLLASAPANAFIFMGFGYPGASVYRAAPGYTAPVTKQSTASDWPSEHYDIHQRYDNYWAQHREYEEPDFARG